MNVKNIHDKLDNGLEKFTRGMESWAAISQRDYEHDLSATRAARKLFRENQALLGTLAAKYTTNQTFRATEAEGQAFRLAANDFGEARNIVEDITGYGYNENGRTVRIGTHDVARRSHNQADMAEELSNHFGEVANLLEQVDAAMEHIFTRLSLMYQNHQAMSEAIPVTSQAMTAYKNEL